MRIAVGIDVAKEVHWATAVDETGRVVLDRRVPNTPAALDALVTALQALDGELTIGLDVVGGIAGLAQAMLLAAGFRLVHVSGLAVNRARQGTRGGESKSDPRDARVIADQVRLRRDLRPIEVGRELDLEIRLLIGRRRDLVEEQTRRLGRLHDLLVSIFPGLEHGVNLTTKAGLWLLTAYATPGAIRAAGPAQLAAHLERAGGLARGPSARLVEAAVAAAEAQHIAVPGERAAAALIHELATEALAARQRLGRLDRELEALLARHPDAALIRSLPGMGATLTAELIAQAGDLSRFRSADALAAAAGLAPVLRQSGKARFLRRPNGGNKGLKYVFYQGAFCSLHSPDSRAFYARKRRAGKRHHQALIALARRRINVLWAILHSRQPFQPHFKLAAA
jgi:transposase